MQCSNVWRDFNAKQLKSIYSDGLYEGVCEPLRPRETELTYQYVVIERKKGKRHSELLHDASTYRHLKIDDCKF